MNDPIQNTNGMKLSIFQKMNSINKFIAAAAVIIFPISVLTVDNLSGLLFVIAILLGLWQMLVHFKSLLPISKDEKLFLFSLTFLLVTAIITTLINDADFARADRFIAFLLVIPAYYFFKRNLSDEKYVWIGLIVGSFVVFGKSVYLYLVLDHVQLWRETIANEVVNKILFGDIALCFGGLSLAGVSWFMQQRTWFMAFPSLALVAGIAASVLSLARGSWLAVPFLLVLFIWYSSKRIRLRTSLLIMALLIMMIASVYLLPQTGVQNHFDTTLGHIHNYISSKNVNDEARTNSIGARLEMWRAAVTIFQQSPLVGSGWGSYTELAQAQVDAGLVNPVASKFYHPHNQYISALAKGGVLALGAITVLFLLPGYVFYKIIRDSVDSGQHRLALAGLVLIVAYASFGLTESIFERSKPVIFFGFYLAVFMALVQQKLKKNHGAGSSAALGPVGINSDQDGSICQNAEAVNINPLQNGNFISLEADVARVFKDSKSVNAALRMLIDIADKK